MTSVIEVKGISKKYLISHERQSYVALRDLLAHPLESWRRIKAPMEDFWALRDLNFTINQGDVLGIIGPNGSGKSTLLKILSRITPPTKGEVIVRGRIASLLEVGTGFHSELSGRENIYLSGVILGMTKSEIARKFDEIVDFSGIEKFLDTPVKRYSSGMMIRLGFAVAASLESDILVVDEVLAVGDAEFQKKCLGKMSEITKSQNRTILFVSHNMNFVRSLCKRGLYLENGQLLVDGSIDEVIDHYNNKGWGSDINIASIHRPDWLSNKARIIDLELWNDGNKNPQNIDSTKDTKVLFTIDAKEPITAATYLAIKDSSQSVMLFDSGLQSRQYFSLQLGINKIELNFKASYLASGSYRLDCGLNAAGGEWFDLASDAYFFSVNNLDVNNSGFNQTQAYGIYYVENNWHYLN